MAHLDFQSLVTPLSVYQLQLCDGTRRQGFVQRAERRGSGREISRSSEDRWLMDFLRAHHDGQLIGANTVREEPGPDGAGADYAIEDEQLRVYRKETLGLDKQKIIVLTCSGNVRCHSSGFRFDAR